MRFNTEQHFEMPPQYLVTPPPIESLLQGETSNNFWPNEVLENPELPEQLHIRKEASQALSAIFAHFPNPETTYEQMALSTEIGELELTRVYKSLSQMLEKEAASKRLILYIPFELLPDLQSTVVDKNSSLAQEMERFITLYREAWYALLSDYDLRADFFDGDVPEPEHQNESHPSIVKASHLIPKLVERGILKTEEVITVMERAQDSILRNSIADTLPVLQDMNLLTSQDYDRLAHSENQTVQNVGIILKLPPIEKTEAIPFTDIDSIVTAYISELTQHEEIKQGSHTRAHWLYETAREQTASKYANALAQLLRSEKGDSTLLDEYLASHPEKDFQLLISETIRNVCTPETSSPDAQSIHSYAIYQELLKQLWETNEVSVHDSVRTTLLYLFSLGTITEEELTQYGIEKPSIAISFEERGKNIRAVEEIMTTLATRCGTHAELSRMVYPITVLLGSRMKGYATESADIDVAIFVRPGVRDDEREHLQELIRTTFDHELVGGHAMEFWLHEEQDSLSIRDYENPDPQRGDSTLPHPLLGTWCGSKDEIRLLYEKLMPEYLYSKGKTILGQDAQSLWLKEMEHTLLQYRLLHKGYRSVYPEKGGIHTSHADQIDGTSTFYDSGYRRLALKIFVDKVFLPQIDRP